MYPRFGWYFGVVGLLVLVALLIVAVRAYRTRRTANTLHLLLAVICYVVAANSWFTFPFVAGLFLGSRLTAHASLVLADARYYSEQSLQILFAAFLMTALLSFTRECVARHAPNI